MPAGEFPIRTEGLSKHFNGMKAVENLNLSIDARSCVGFLGPNGAGKTTTIKILTGMLKPTKGRAFLNGIDVTAKAKEALASVGAVVESPEFYPDFTPRETLFYLGRLRGMGKGEIGDRSQAVLELVKMSEWSDKKIGTFSKGMKQRIAVAQALLHDPSILILDEPTIGLDPRGMAEVRVIVKDLKARGITIFMSSHLLYEVQEVSDKVALIDKGKLLVYDEVDRLSKLRSSVKVEIDVVGSFDKRVLREISSLPNVKGVESPNSTKIIVDFQGDQEAKANLMDSVRELGLKIHSFRELGMPLESLYLELVKESK